MASVDNLLLSQEDQQQVYHLGHEILQTSVVWIMKRIDACSAKDLTEVNGHTVG